MINKAMLKAKQAAFSPITQFYNTDPVLFNDSTVFEDKEFPAGDETIVQHPQGQKLEAVSSIVSWARPRDFLKAPKLFIDGIDVSEVCW